MDRGTGHSSISLQDERYGEKDALRIKELGSDQNLRSRKQKLSKSVVSISFLITSKKYSFSHFHISKIGMSLIFSSLLPVTASQAIILTRLSCLDYKYSHCHHFHRVLSVFGVEINCHLKYLL